MNRSTAAQYVNSLGYSVVKDGNAQALAAKAKKAGAPAKTPASAKAPCRLHAAGNCTFGKSCKFSHVTSPPAKAGAAAKDGGTTKGKGKGKGKKGGEKPVSTLAAIPLLSPITVLSLLHGTAGSPEGGSGNSDPPPESKPKKAPMAPTKARKASTFWQQCLKTIPGRAVKAGVALPTCLSGSMQPESGAVPALAAPKVHHGWFPRRKYYLEYIGDTGAGETVWSRKALLEHGVPEHVIDKCLRHSNAEMEFDTGGGMKKARNSIVGATPLLGHSNEMYELANSPIAVPTGHCHEASSTLHLDTRQPSLSRYR